MKFSELMKKYENCCGEIVFCDDYYCIALSRLLDFGDYDYYIYAVDSGRSGSYLPLLIRAFYGDDNEEKAYAAYKALTDK